ncbi:MAG TPA: hypothetical protein VK828_19280 [Terriglobales bacterium]|nr:hypothetical protein [Terriglobales bacterium]
MVEDPQWELALLATVQSFYHRLLSDQLGGEMPAPAELAPEVISRTPDVRSTLDQMQLWIQLLDMAITPAMLRIGVQSDMDPEVAEALLRYFARHRDDSGANRDKTDLVATFLFRHPRVPGQWERRGYGLDGSIPLSPFEIALLEILSESDVPVLPENHVQLLREFGPLLDQANRFQDFSALMDSGIIQRVRELKASLGESIYHPGVLATLAPYNAAFGDRFYSLFTSATEEIKDFAKRLEELGGSILSTVDGVEVTVEHVAALNQQALLKGDYGSALEKFRRVSRLKKELERRPPIRRSHPDHASSGRAVGAGAAAVAPALALKYTPAAITPQALSVEEAKLRRVEESVRVFVRVADPKFRQIVPMRYFNLMLNAAEVEAYTADYLEQPGPRADAARMLLRLVAVNARLTTEMEELKRSRNSPSVWKLHADSLVVLIDLAKRLAEAVDRLALAAGQQAEGQGNGEPLRNSLDKLRERTAEAAKLIAEA